MSKDKITIELIENIIEGNLISLETFERFEPNDFDAIESIKRNNIALQKILNEFKKTPPDCNDGESIN